MSGAFKSINHHESGALVISSGEPLDMTMVVEELRGIRRVLETRQVVFEAPEVKPPDIYLNMPDWKPWPEMKIPEIKVPEIKVPEITLPPVEVRQRQTFPRRFVLLVSLLQPTVLLGLYALLHRLDWL